MTPIVADTGPLIALARGVRLDLLRHLYRQVIIPPRMHREIAIASRRPGATVLAGSVVGSGYLG